MCTGHREEAGGSLTSVGWCPICRAGRTACPQCRPHRRRRGSPSTGNATQRPASTRALPHGAVPLTVRPATRRQDTTPQPPRSARGSPAFTHLARAGTRSEGTRVGLCGQARNDLPDPRKLTGALAPGTSKDTGQRPAAAKRRGGRPFLASVGAGAVCDGSAPGRVLAATGSGFRLRAACSPYRYGRCARAPAPRRG
jgi:hypothetical protein